LGTFSSDRRTLIRARLVTSNKDAPRGHQESPCGWACALFWAPVLLEGPQASPGSRLTQARSQRFILLRVHASTYEGARGVGSSGGDPHMNMMREVQGHGVHTDGRSQ